MVIKREWAMPNKWTFLIPPIAELVARYVGDGKGWIDPFAGQNSPAEITNDLNPNNPATYHMDALEFISSLQGVFQGVLFDPPYSLRQVKECYESVGRDFTMADSQDAVKWTAIKQEITKRIVLGGYALSFGWNSQGMNKQNGFELEELLLVCHGGGHNDTIVTVERKIATELNI